MAHDDLRPPPLEEASALPASCYTVPVFFELERERVFARSEADVAFSDEIQREAVAICELVRKGLLSGGYAPGRLSPKRESGDWHFQNLLRTAYTDD